MTQPIDFLLSRSSMKLVTAPAPSDEDLAKILQSAMAAPDHGGLQPWRFKIIRGQAIQKFADFSIALRQGSDTPFTPQKEAATRAWLSEVPMIIAVACHIDYGNTAISETERMLATGAAVTNILNAAHMLGYGAFWSTGIATYIDEFQCGLGFDALDYRFLGFIAIGTPKMPIPPKKRPDYAQFTEEWSEPLDV